MRKRASRTFVVREAELHKRVVDPAVRREKGLPRRGEPHRGERGENGAVNCKTRSGCAQNQAKKEIGRFDSGEIKLRMAQRSKRGLDSGSSALLRQ